MTIGISPWPAFEDLQALLIEEERRVSGLVRDSLGITCEPHGKKPLEKAGGKGVYVSFTSHYYLGELLSDSLYHASWISTMTTLVIWSGRWAAL